MISQGSTERARRPELNFNFRRQHERTAYRKGMVDHAPDLAQVALGHIGRFWFDSRPSFFSISTRRNFDPYDPPKLRDGVCKMCGEVKLIREDMHICEECWEYNKDL